MKEMIKSDTTGRMYCPSKCVRIVNTMQIAAYLKAGVELLDIYASQDFETNRPVIVAVFDRENSRPAYQSWCNHEL